MFGFILFVVWSILESTPSNNENVVYAQVFTSFTVLQQIASAAGTISFAASLLEVPKSATPPSIEYFRKLPSAYIEAWGVYLLLSEKEGARPKIYIGMGTESVRGVQNRRIQSLVLSKIKREQSRSAELCEEETQSIHEQTSSTFPGDDIDEDNCCIQLMMQRANQNTTNRHNDTRRSQRVNGIYLAVLGMLQYLCLLSGF